MYRQILTALGASALLALPLQSNAQTTDSTTITIAPIDREIDLKKLLKKPSPPHSELGSSQEHGSLLQSSEELPVATVSALEGRILEVIGRDLQSLGSEMAIDELNRFARFALEIERPDIFRAVMVSQVDEHWAGLSDARTALNMIAWLPDTADNLPPRITAARLAISAGELPDIEAQRLWRDLRARVERVGDPSLLIDLAGAMILSGSEDLMVATVNRFHPTDRKRIETFIYLLETHGPNVSRDVSTLIYDAIIDLGGSGAGGDASVSGIARAFWSVGRTEEALVILGLISDPLVRIRTHFELLAIEPIKFDAKTEKDEVTPPIE